MGGFTNSTVAGLINATNSSVEKVSISTNDVAERVTDVFVENVFGSPELFGLSAIGFAQYLMIANGTHEAVQISIMAPAIMVMGYFGYFPYADGFIYSLLLAISYIAGVYLVKNVET